MTLPRFTDSLSRSVLSPPVQPGERPLSFYACGITPYASAHIGHARSFVVFDAMAHALRRAGYQVELVRNPDYNWAPPTAKHQGPAWLDRIVWKFIQEPSVRFASLQAGEVDVALLGLAAGTDGDDLEGPSATQREKPAMFSQQLHHACTHGAEPGDADPERRIHGRLIRQDGVRREP